jgi:hypothetical protein
MTTAHRFLHLALALILAAGAWILPGPQPAIARDGDKRPNLQMVRLRDLTIDHLNGRRLLRFTTVFSNVGRGPFELKGDRSGPNDPTMEMDQVMYRWDGSTRRIGTPAVSKYAGDGHDHWHVQDVVIYELWRIGDLATTRRGAKTGFCFFDTTPVDLSLPGARRSGYYRQEWCGERNVLHNRVGVSVGWGDRYPWNFVFQWIDITGLPGGRYKVRATVDIQDFYDESVEDDNCTFAVINIPKPGAGNGVTVERTGFSCGHDAITPVTSFGGGETFDPPRDLVFEPGTHIGYRLNSKGTELRRTVRQPTSPRFGAAAFRGTPPGRSGRWLYIVEGPYAGWWFKDSAAIDMVPA